MKNSKLKKLLKDFLIAIAISFAFIIALPVGISIYLSPQDDLQNTDAVVVVSGGDTDARIDEGVKMYLQKWAPKIIFSGAAAEGEVSNALAMKRIAMSKGVPEKDILIEESSKTTKENASMTEKVIKDNGIKSIILVTSPYHQRRAYMEFKRVLGKDFIIINHSASDETWRKKNWWENTNARFLTLGEILKNAYALLGNK